MKIVIIIPTYNEKSSISFLINAIEEELKLIKNHQTILLFIDGHSTDGTTEVIQEKQREYKDIHLIVEKEKRGLGAAYITGMNYAIHQLSVDAIMEFDGDFQHDPRDIKRLIAEMDNGYDYVIGSRYVAGGGIPPEWAWHRKFLSKFGGIFVRKVLGLPVYDSTSGFKLSRVKNFAERLPLDENKILTKKYAYKIEFLQSMVKMGAKIKEVPIKFLTRKNEKSKSTLMDIFNFLRVVIILKLRDLFK